MVVTTRSMMARRFVPLEEPSVSRSSTIGTDTPPRTSPSDLPPGSTRLIRLEPSSVLHAPIQMSLLEISLSSCPEFECLSYTWGTDDSSSAASSAVNVDGKTVMIRIILFDALCRLRLVDRDRLLWIDALSINQTDLEEKAQQVAMISKIFQQLVRVLAWVGEHSDNSELVFTLSKEIQDLGDRKSLERRHFARRKNIICAWSSFLDRRYFHRVWTFQEVVCHRDVLICCGPDSQNWEDLITQPFQDKAAMLNYDDFYTLNVTEESFMKTFTREEARRWLSSTDCVRIVDSARSRHAAGGVGVLEYISRVSSRECSDRRDRVYAVLSLARDDAIVASVGTDYSISVPELCCKVITVTSKSSHYLSVTLVGLLDDLRCDHNETGCFVDLTLDQPESAIMNEWNWDVEYLVRDLLLTEYSEPRTDVYPYSRGRKSHLLSWRTAARQRGSWPQAPGQGYILIISTLSGDCIPQSSSTSHERPACKVSSMPP